MLRDDAITKGMLKCMKFIVDNPNSSISIIAKNCDFSFTYTFNLISSLINKNYVSKTKKGKRTIINAIKTFKALEIASWEYNGIKGLRNGVKGDVKMGVIDYDSWHDIGQVLIKCKKVYSIRDLSVRSGVNATYTKRIIDWLRSEGLVYTFELSRQIMIESNLLSEIKLKRSFEKYMKKYHR